jgi:protein-disulfide isomerase
VLEKNPDTVKIVFKHLPLRMHQMAEPAALAAIAAQNQGKFWQMHDAMFSTPKLSKESIDKSAKEVGLDMQQFKKDLNSPQTKQKLAKDLADARKTGVSGTPTLFVNGRRVKDRGPDAIQKLIDQEKAKTASKPSN